MKKVKRKIIKIDESLCNGCGLCMPACPEQALQLVDTPDGKKARLVKELYCDGLGACLGACPTGALVITEADADVYNEEATIARIKEVAPEMLRTHVEHLKKHEAELPEHHSHPAPKGFNGCPSAKVMQWHEKKKATAQTQENPSELRQWPIQLHLVSPLAPCFKNADLVIVADCVPFAYADFHQYFLKEKVLVIACPKLDDTEPYAEKLAAIFEQDKPKSITVVHMEVPCCFGLVHIVKQALQASAIKIPFKEKTISIKGEVLTG